MKVFTVRTHPEASLVVDDIASLDPRVARGVEIRGRPEARETHSPPVAGRSRQIIGVHAQRLISWGVDPDHPGRYGRDVPVAGAGRVA
jgi:pyridoxamine 5'-phosphate oxidase family protein